MTRLTRAKNKPLQKYPDLIKQLEGGSSYDVTINYWGSTCWRPNYSQKSRFQPHSNLSQFRETPLTSRFYLSCYTGLKRISHSTFRKKLKQRLESICHSKSYHSKSHLAPISTASTFVFRKICFYEVRARYTPCSD